MTHSIPSPLPSVTYKKNGDGSTTARIVYADGRVVVRSSKDARTLQLLVERQYLAPARRQAQLATEQPKPAAPLVYLMPLPSGTHALILGAGKSLVGYWLKEIRSELGGRGFCVEKADKPGVQPATYHVHVSDGTDRGVDGKPLATCDCPAGERWGRCKHSDAIVTLIDRGDMPATPAAAPGDDADDAEPSEPAPGTACARCCGLCGDPLDVATEGTANYHAACQDSYAAWSVTVAAAEVRLSFDQPRCQCGNRSPAPSRPCVECAATLADYLAALPAA